MKTFKLILLGIASLSLAGYFMRGLQPFAVICLGLIILYLLLTTLVKDESK